MLGVSEKIIRRRRRVLEMSIGYQNSYRDIPNEDLDMLGEYWIYPQNEWFFVHSEHKE